MVGGPSEPVTFRSSVNPAITLWTSAIASCDLSCTPLRIRSPTVHVEGIGGAQCESRARIASAKTATNGKLRPAEVSSRQAGREASALVHRSRVTDELL